MPCEMCASTSSVGDLWVTNTNSASDSSYTQTTLSEGSWQWDMTGIFSSAGTYTYYLVRPKDTLNWSVSNTYEPLTLAVKFEDPVTDPSGCDPSDIVAEGKPSELVELLI